MIFHDGLSQWWEKEAQDYIAELGFADRQVRCMGSTNIGTRYHSKIVGDSPEVCRGLDSHGFADLKLSVNYHTALSSMYLYNDPRRFLFGTPDEAMRTMERCWEVAPSSDRIVEDISKFARILESIIEYRGCVVPDYYLRSGRRHVSVRSEAVTLKKKPRDRQRKVTLRGLTLPHHDCDDAYLRLGRSDDSVHDAVDQVYLDIVETDEFLGQSSTSEEELGDVQGMMDNLNFAEDYSAV